TPVPAYAVRARLGEQGGRANANGFLPAVKMAEPADLLARALVFLEGALFEAPDQHHHSQAVALGTSIAGPGLPVGRLRLAVGVGLFRCPLFHFVGYGHWVCSA